VKKKTLVILADGFEEIEAITVIDVLRRANIAVTIAGLSGLEVKGAHGITLRADKLLADSGADFAAVVLPGGMPGVKNLAASGEVNSLIRKLFAAGKVIAAICAAPSVVLVPTGILKDKRVTGFPGMTESFEKSTRYEEDKVVVDGQLITSRGPGTALLFALAIVEKLSGKETAEKLKKTTLAE
jgi:4-methyl-5(b-hydroxyethyl)-thiazole monophosphate biosynthesis